MPRNYKEIQNITFPNLDVPTNLKGENVEVAGQEDDLSWNTSLILNF